MIKMANIKMTTEDLIKYQQEHPDASNTDISNHFGVSVAAVGQRLKTIKKKVPKQSKKNNPQEEKKRTITPKKNNELQDTINIEITKRLIEDCWSNIKLKALSILYNKVRKNITHRATKKRLEYLKCEKEELYDAIEFNIKNILKSLS